MRILAIGSETPPLTRGRLLAALMAREADGNTPAYAGKTLHIPLSPYRTRKHPRLRGEDLQANNVCVTGQETPPLTRGRRKRLKTFKRKIGNTPAYAGKTGTTSMVKMGYRKHPRLRGEDLPDQARSRGHVETPPLTRGRLYVGAFARGVYRNTPAYAGKTAPLFESPRDGQKHPRLRGEDYWLANGVGVWVETPPLTRGRLDFFEPSRTQQQKHPRLRGEDPVWDGVPRVEKERPPLTRGRPIVSDRRGDSLRNTPAYAGKTGHPVDRDPMDEKHPRLRGEDGSVERNLPVIWETPPLTRGRPEVVPESFGLNRNTPAYAGKTSRKRRKGAPAGKHPRLRGEDSGRRCPQG